ncbi:HipA domain-containing protein [Myroides sp. M-43]|uniref:HipA domain-containing protein n=1 Tax=Myroides oncorhynchi TaxID=2893756 RepID=UPI001E5E88F3|nr:HipA domain-containing protein [Myroides oncorhynchi]MCC9043696.1 HipA domain-containing protein [Myroides oncorhynchi]
MISRCLYCYQVLETNASQEYHDKCAIKFFGSKIAPILPYAMNEMDRLAKEVVQRSVTVPGVQPKLSMGIVKDALGDKTSGRMTILDALEGLYILKPQNEQFYQMPENEHLSMRLAELFTISVVPSSLIRLASGELCYLTKRIDRSKSNSKIHMIDFLQILELEHKYLGTMEQVGKTIGDLSAHTLLDKFRFFELAVFNFIIGNNDMHLKNFSMILSNNDWLLAPGYDLINVKLILPKDDEDTALMLGGKKKNHDKSYFERFGTVLQLNEKQINSVFTRIKKWLPKAEKLIKESFLSAQLKQDYLIGIIERIKRLE